MSNVLTLDSHACFRIIVQLLRADRAPLGKGLIMSASAAGVAIPCPNCRKPTTSLKRYSSVEWFVFLVIFFWVRRAVYTACPGCMRGIVVQRFAYNLIPANVAMFILGPMYIIQGLFTFLPGHSKAILTQLGPALAKEAERNQLKDENTQTMVSALNRANQALDRGDPDTALDVLLRACAQLHQVSSWEITMVSYVQGIADGKPAGMRQLLAIFPEPVVPLMNSVLDKFAAHPPTSHR